MDVGIELVELVVTEVPRGDEKACIEGEVHEKEGYPPYLVDPLIQERQPSSPSIRH